MSLKGNMVVMAACYSYIAALIFLSGKIDDTFTSRKVSRKFLHAMIGNLPFMMPFFTDNIFPFLVASPFVIVTFLASPFCPFVSIRKRMKDLADITEEGHHTGLILYAISYSALALFFGITPYIVAAGIFPMAYGDSAAAIVGESVGRHRFKVFEEKSLEGSIGMFLASFISLSIGMVYFTSIYGFSLKSQIIPILSVSLITTLAEAISPKGFDNISIPLLGALTFIILGGGA
ncbi:phosphatidate cytidylyltransferase [Candidatus Bathyarchaeota archaeon]|nr:phosphatidate cytidylyltransferase [Candidatus Bathyarchaeota archaeon]